VIEWSWRVLTAVPVFILAACSSLSVPMNEPLRSAAGNTDCGVFGAGAASRSRGAHAIGVPP